MPTHLFQFVLTTCYNAHLISTITRAISGTRDSVSERFWYQNVSILDFIGTKDKRGGGDNWELQDMQSSSQNVTINKPTPNFYGVDGRPVTQPTVSEDY